MRWLLIPLIATSTLLAGEQGAKVEYLGGTLPQVEPGQDLRLIVIDASDLEIAAKRQAFRVPYSNINQIEYGQKVGRNILPAIVISPLFLLNKTRKHFLTVGYTDDGGRQHALVVRLDKGDVRAVLASLEARTGRRVVYLDDEARKM
jgi:hypothetical protein